MTDANPSFSRSVLCGGRSEDLAPHSIESARLCRMFRASALCRRKLLDTSHRAKANLAKELWMLEALSFICPTDGAQLIHHGQFAAANRLERPLSRRDEAIIGPAD